MGNKIVENETLYTFLLNSMYFNIARGEKRIFELWRLGENNCNIAKELNISEGTVRNRKKTLIARAFSTIESSNNKDIKDLLISQTKDTDISHSFCTYILLFPNNKVYIGQTVNTKNRWGKNGNGYTTNKEMYADIQKYGWDNIKKQIVYDNLTYNESLEKEKELIIHYKSNIPEYGYNREF